MNTSTATDDTPLRQAWPQASRGQRAGLPLASLTYCFTYASPSQGFHALVSPGVWAVSSRTVMNNGD